MLSDEILDKVIERLVNRIEEANIYTLKSIGETIKKIGTIKPSDVTQLVEAMQYGADYDKIVKKLAEITDLNVKDIYEIFDEVAKTDSRFAEQFYVYRNKKYIPYDENINLQRQVRLIADMTAEAYRNMANSTVIGFKIKDENGKVIHKGLKETYQNVIDRAVMAISQGKSTYEGQVYSILKEIGKSGLSTVDYESGRTRRLDSAVRMNIKGALRDLHNRTQEELGKEFGADGVEISVHGHPAPDHEDVQGRQFSIEEFDNFQNDRRATTYTGMVFEPDFNGRDRRAISQYNCYHYTFSIILGVNRPQYTNEQLKKIKEDNDVGFDFEGKHYTLYEGTQLQRQLETEIRRQKDLQILGKAGGNEKLTNEAQKNINILTKKYQELSNVSGLPTKLERLRVDGYKRTDVNKIKVQELQLKTLDEWNEYFGKKYGSYDVMEGHVKYSKEKDNWVEVNDNLKYMDSSLLNSNLQQVDNLYSKYKLNGEGLSIKMEHSNEYVALAREKSNISFSYEKTASKENYLKRTKNNIENDFYMKIKKGNEDKYAITHEMGHIIENRIINKDNIIERSMMDNKIKDTLLSNVSKRTGLSNEQIKEKYFSGYAKSRKSFEWFAESFTQLELGEKNEWIEEFEKWLKTQY